MFALIIYILTKNAKHRPRLHVHRCTHDYGPATKLIGTLEFLEQEKKVITNGAMIVFTGAYIECSSAQSQTYTQTMSLTHTPPHIHIDDDQQWQPHAISTLLAQAQPHPESAWSYYTYRYWT